MVTTPYKVTQVAEVGPRRIQEITALRAVVEPLAVRLALPRLRETELSELKRLLGEMRSAGARGERDNLIELHLAFHRTYYAVADNELLLQLWTLMEGQTRLYLHVHHLPPEMLTDTRSTTTSCCRRLRAAVDDIDVAVTQHVDECAPGWSPRIKLIDRTIDVPLCVSHTDGVRTRHSLAGVPTPLSNGGKMSTAHGFDRRPAMPTVNHRRLLGLATLGASPRCWACCAWHCRPARRH